MEITHQTPVLIVADLDAALTFYRDKLAFSIDWVDREVLAAISTGEVSVFLQRAERPSPTTLIWNVPSADEVLKILEDAGVTVLDPIATRSWGMREFTIADPWGNRFRIGHVDESEADYSAFKSEVDASPADE